MNAPEIVGYANAYQTYVDRGWAPIKLKARTKKPMPKGFTGWKGKVASGADMHAWAEEEPGGNLALRLPNDAIGIDLDAWGDKTGAATNAEAEKRWGRLPYSPTSTSRDDGVSGIRLYRIPAGVVLRDRIEFPDLGLGGIEIIQYHHRVVMCWPSIHPEGRQYRWLGIDGGPLATPPALDDLPDLPAAWLAALRKPDKPGKSDTAGGADRGRTDGPYNVRKALTEGRPLGRVAQRLGVAMVDCGGESRHDTIRDHVLALLRYGRRGDPGVDSALTALKHAFVAAVENSRAGGRAEAEKEFDKLIWSDRTAELLAEPDREYPPDVKEVDRAALAPPGDGTGDGPDDDGVPKLAAWCLSRAQLADLDEPEPLIDNTIDKSTVALLYGKWGSGKSFIALDWGANVAAGRAWQGQDTEQHRVLYLAAEGAHGMKIRTDAWEQGWRTQIPDDKFTVLRRAINLTNNPEVRELAALIDWGGYGFVLIDTLARCMVGADENSAKDCGQVVDALGRLLDKTPGGRGAVIGVHHTGKDGKTFRGSSVFEAGADTVYSVLTEGRAINLNREKRKDGPIADMHSLRIDPVEGTKSCIVSLHHGVEKRDRAQRLLATFLHHFSTTGATKSELRLVSELTEGTFYRALSDLLQSGDLVNEGTDKRPFYKVVIR